MLDVMESRKANGGTGRNGNSSEHIVKIGPYGLSGELTAPERAEGVIVIASGAGDGCDALRERYVAERLAAEGFATLALRGWEGGGETGAAERLASAVDWAARREGLTGLPAGLFGGRSAAAAVLEAEALAPVGLGAAVCLGGRPDEAGERLAKAAAPTLLIVGAQDAPAMASARAARERHGGECEVAACTHATEHWEEAGALAYAADRAARWFAERLAGRAPRNVVQRMGPGAQGRVVPAAALR